MCTAAKSPSLPANLIIRQATAEDASLLCLFIRELARFEKLIGECHITEEAVAEHLLAPNGVGRALIAECGGDPVGFAVYYRTLSTFAARPGVFLEDLFVLPAHRKQGIGRALMREVARIARHDHCGRFEWIALKWNTKAHELYRSIGSREMDEWTLFRMDAAALEAFADCGPTPLHSHGTCRCGGKGHAQENPEARS